MSYTGFKNGDGIFVSGGSNANLIAMFSARNRILPESRFVGYNNYKKSTAFVNEKAHYSFETAANIIGVGSLILSDKHKHLMKGLERADSFTWNPHKLMNIPLICSTLLVKKRGTLQHNITDINADYIFHDIDKIEDLGKKS